MPASIAPVEQIVKTALLDQSISTNELVTLMRKNQLTSAHLLTYIDDDTFWPLYPPDSPQLARLQRVPSVPLVSRGLRV